MDIIITKKRIKNIYLRIKAPDGSVSVSAPIHMPDDVIQHFIRKKARWIYQKQQEVRKRPTATLLKYVSGETLFLWGKECRLDVREYSVNALRGSYVVMQDNHIILFGKTKLTPKEREKMILEWYREEIKKALPTVVKRAEGLVGVTCREWRVKNMKTKWGTCNILARRIWLNVQLATKKPECLEYVVIHELVHLHERNHNARFYSLMDLFLPNWREVKLLLNS